MKELFYFFVETQDVSFTWIGGPAEPDGDHVWLCRPDGQRLLRVPKDQVHQSTPEETAARIVQDRKAARERIEP